MDALLALGCGLGGLALGGALDSLTGRIVRHPDPDPSEDAAVPAQVALVGGPAPVPVVPDPVAVPATLRVPGVGELGASGLLTGALFALAAWRLGAVASLAAYCALFAGLVALAVVDAREGIVPRTVLYPTLAATTVGLLAAAAAGQDWSAFAHAAVGGAAAFSVFFALWWCFPRGIGFGDVRLAGLVGAGLGWMGFGELYVGFLAAFAAAAVVGVGVMAVRGSGRGTRLAFAPPLALGAAFGVLWGQWAVHLWLHRG